MSQRELVVLGGGIAGLSVAWQLARAGEGRVTLLDKEPMLASQASGRNAAIFRVVDGDPVAVALARRSRALFAELDAAAPLLRATGGLYLGTAAELRGLAALAARCGVPVEPLGREALGGRVPALRGTDAEAGLFVAEDGVLDIHALTEALARAARAAGATLRTGAEVTRITRDAARVTGVELADGSFAAADVVVLAAGAWVEALGATCGAALPIRPVRRHLALLVAPEGVPADGPVVWRLGEEVYFRPEPTGVLASPCDEEPWPAEEPPAAPAAREELARRLARTAPGLAGAAVRTAWACLRTFAPDRGFVAGPDPRAPGLWWIAGLGGHGMTCGVALGELVAARVLGHPAAHAARVAPRRLLPARALLLDLDGTLADTLDDLAAAVNHALAALGQPARTRDEIRAFIGEGAAILVRRALPAARADLGDAALSAFRARYAEHLLDATRPYPGIDDALAALQARGVPLAVLSNKPQPMTEALVRALFPGVRFAAVWGERPGVPRKPDPAAALQLADALGVPAAEVALVGDGTTDMQTAVAAGMRAVAATWGFRTRDELVAAGAERLVDAPAELLTLV